MEEKITFKCKKKDCVWRSNHFLIGCDYSSFHDHTRVKGLPKDKWDPKYCDKYEPGKSKRQAPFKTPPTLNHEMAMDLYKKGLNDTEIANKMNCSIYRVRNWRTSHKLKPNAQNGERYTIDTTRATELYHLKYSDSAIGRELGCSADTIARWRKAHGLKANSLNRVNYTKMQELYHQGLSDKMISRELSCGHGTVAGWRRAHNLQPNAVGSSTSIDWALGEALYKQGLSDTEISIRLHCRTEAVRRWRSRNGLPANASKTTRPTRIGKAGLERILALCERGLFDPEIAIIMGIITDSVYKVRHRHGVPSNNKNGQRRIPLDVDEAVEDGFMYDSRTELWWVMRNAKIVAVARDQAEAAELYEQHKWKYKRKR